MFCADWILPVDGNELKAACKYCNRVLNARYLQLLRHSLSNRHLCNASAAAAVTFPVDVDSYKAHDGSTVPQHLSHDNDTDADAVLENSSVHVDECSRVEFKSEQKFSDVQQFDVDALFTGSNVDGRKKVGCLKLQLIISDYL